MNRTHLFLKCKHKHMMKSGAPPDKVLPCLFPIEFRGFTSRINSKGYHSLISGFISIFRDLMGTFKCSPMASRTNVPYTSLYLDMLTILALARH